MVISRRKKIILWCLVTICGLSWFWTIGYLVCEALGKNPICKGVRRIGGKVIPHIDLGKFYKNYIKKPICKAGTALGLVDTVTEARKKFLKKICPEKGAYVSPNIIHIEFTRKFVEEVVRNPKKYIEVVKYIKNNYPVVKYVEYDLYGSRSSEYKRWDESSLNPYVPKDAREFMIKSGHKDKVERQDRIYSQYAGIFRDHIYIEKPLFEYDLCYKLFKNIIVSMSASDIITEDDIIYNDYFFSVCPQNRSNKIMVKKSKEVIAKLKNDKSLQGIVADAFTYICGENFIPEEALEVIFPGITIPFPVNGKDSCTNMKIYDEKENLIIEKFIKKNIIQQPVCKSANDPLFSLQWNMRKSSQQFQCAWPITMGDNNILATVVDTGTFPEHPDLKMGFLLSHNLYFSHWYCAKGLIRKSGKVPWIYVRVLDAHGMELG